MVFHTVNKKSHKYLSVPGPLNNGRRLKLVFKELVRHKRHRFIIFKLFHGFLRQDNLIGRDRTSTT